MKALVILVAGFIALVGCSSSEINNQVTENSTLEYSFEVEQNYQAVYRKILQQGRDCVKPGLTAQMVVEGALFNELQAADITVVLYGIFSRYPHLRINIIATGANNAKVTVSNKLPQWNSYARAIMTWVNGDSTRCAVSD